MAGVLVCPHKDLAGTTSMSLSSGLGLLAGRRCYAVFSLTSPDTVLYREPRHSKWEVVSSEWSPTRDNLVAVAANNKGSDLSVLHTTLFLHCSSKEILIEIPHSTSFPLILRPYYF